METNTGHKMAGIPTPTPGSAEGTEDQDMQSHVPPSSHTPGSAENGALDDSKDESQPKPS